MRGATGFSRRTRPVGGPTIVTATLAALLLFPAALPAQEPEAPAPVAAIAPPAGVLAVDSPDDRGGSVDVSWDLSPDDAEGRVLCYRIYRSAHPDTGFAPVGLVAPGVSRFRDSAAPDGTPLHYRVAVSDGEREVFSASFGPVEALPQWFHRGRITVLIASLGFVVAIVYFVRAAKAGKDLFIRRLAGLDHMDDAVGRATEMGKPILFISGLSTISDVATIAAVNILGEVAKKTAEYNTRLIVPCADPIVMAVEQEVVKEAYAKVGRVDAYNEDDVFYLTRSQFAYVAGVSGIMVRQRPATILYMGMFYAESLVLAETGASVGSIQIAGTDAVTQLPFFITSCDYTLIGEELYAASAYLSREPVLLGGLKGQDMTKAAIGLAIVLGAISATLAALGVIPWDFVARVLVNA
ncbi:MAG: hypothetical protein FJY74_02165 [Candidatus Eisenbacteria bacterium]|nr:hypothetical protein [Candidatus Eisenbacteria bacterium]